MVSLTFKKIAKTLREEGVRSLFRKTGKRIRYQTRRLLQDDERLRPCWRSLKNQFDGERAFLLGNGPSLNKTPLHLLKNEHAICFNRFNIMLERLNWTPTFYMTVDNLVLNDMVEDIDEILSITEYLFLPDIHFRGENYYRKIGDRDRLCWMQQVYGRGFSTELPKVHPGGSVIYEAFQVLNYLGFKDIYMIGVDMNFRRHETAKQLAGRQTDIMSVNDDDPNHFDPRYFGKNRSYHQPEQHVIDYIMDSLAYLAEVQDDYGVHVVNAGYDSRVDYFDRVDFMSLFDYSESEQEALFDECVANASRFETAAELAASATALAPETEEWPEGVGDVITDQETGLRLLKQAVFTHIPLGPFRDRYFFVRRD